MQTIERSVIAKALEAFCDKYPTYSRAATALGVTLAQLSTARNDPNSVIPARALSKLGYGYTPAYVRKADMPTKRAKKPAPPKKAKPKKATTKPKPKPATKPAPKKPAPPKKAKPAVAAVSAPAAKPAPKKPSKPKPKAAPKPAEPVVEKAPNAGGLFNPDRNLFPVIGE